MGASGDVTTICEDDPMCMQTTTPSSLQASHKGSQWSECRLGQPSFEGFSEKVTAWAPLAAVRRTSAAMTSGSQIAGRASGMKRPGCEPHHSSMCQSLYASIMASATSLSSVLAKSCPQNCGKDGKQRAPSTPFAFMSFTRSFTS